MNELTDLGRFRQDIDQFVREHLPADLRQTVRQGQQPTREQLIRWHKILAAEGLLVKNHVDCGCILFDAAEQQVKSGGSGPGCRAAVLCGHILPRLLRLEGGEFGLQRLARNFCGFHIVGLVLAQDGDLALCL